jgi:hypothetical protein
VQNTNDGGIRRQNSNRYHHQHCGKENESTKQATQDQPTFLCLLQYERIAAAAIPGSPAGSAPEARFLNLPALTLPAVSK